MGNMIPFDKAQLPAFLASGAGAPTFEDLSGGMHGGFPVISLRGKTWRVTQGGEETLLTRPEAPDEPAFKIQVVILKANPRTSKVFYAHGYVEGSDAKPDCYSNDGVAPGFDAQDPQAEKCGVCPQNTWGSRITESGKKGKACSDSRRVAIAAAGDLETPMLLRVPAASLGALADYGRLLSKRGLPTYAAVVTELSFDANEAYPKIVFKPVRFLTQDEWDTVSRVIEDEKVSQIVGAAELAAPLIEGTAPKIDYTKQASAPAPAPAKPAAKPAAKAAPAPATPTDEDDLAAQLAAAEKAPVNKPAAKKAAPAPAPAPAPAVADNDSELFAQLNAILGGDAE